ncbi:hypothetical protein L2E82_50296 [Cichorium intybus]|nr:hypothetical protein L2E82_50296 [Cichorium intybus]
MGIVQKLIDRILLDSTSEYGVRDIGKTKYTTIQSPQLYKYHHRRSLINTPVFLSILDNRLQLREKFLIRRSFQHYMDYRHLITEEAARESLIAISYGVSEEITYLTETGNENGIKDDTVFTAKIKTMDELRSKLISIAAFEPSADHNSD